jgi:hypothetical protein
MRCGDLPLPPLPEPPPLSPRVEGRAGPGLSDADDNAAAHAAALAAPADATDGATAAASPPPPGCYPLLRLKCLVCEGAALLALGRGEAALACAEAAIAVADGAAAASAAGCAAARAAACSAQASPFPAAAATDAAATGAAVRGVPGLAHASAEPWVLRADALLFVDFGVARSAHSMLWAATGDSSSSSGNGSSRAARALGAYRAALAHAGELRAAGAPRHLRLPFEESRRLKKRIAELSEFTPT